MSKLSNKINALLFGLSEDLAGELLAPLRSCSVAVERALYLQETVQDAVDSNADVIFCGADVDMVTRLRNAKPEAPIIVVSRSADVSDWLDSMEAGATDYCAAPFETSQVKWILESSMRTHAVPSVA